MFEPSVREEFIASLYGELLGIDGVGVDDNFFDLGGHSVHVVRLVNTIRTRVKVDVPLRAVFESPTPAEFATRVAQSPPARPALTRRSRNSPD